MRQQTAPETNAEWMDERRPNQPRLPPIGESATSDSDPAAPPTVLPYRREGSPLIPRPPDVNVNRMFGNFALILTVIAWSSAIGGALFSGSPASNRGFPLGHCLGVIAWFGAAIIGLVVMLHGEIRGLLALVLCVLLVVLGAALQP